jgi:hypothetical protein
MMMRCATRCDDAAMMRRDAMLMRCDAERDAMRCDAMPTRRDDATRRDAYFILF